MLVPDFALEQSLCWTGLVVVSCFVNVCNTKSQQGRLTGAQVSGNSCTLEGVSLIIPPYVLLHSRVCFHFEKAFARERSNR